MFIVIAWLVMGLLMFVQNIEYVVKLSIQDSFIVFILFLVSGPFFIIAAIFEALINLYLPEGWNDDNDDEHRI